MVGGVEFFLSFSFSFFAPKLGQGNSTKKMPQTLVERALYLLLIVRGSSSFVINVSVQLFSVTLIL